MVAQTEQERAVRAVELYQQGVDVQVICRDVEAGRRTVLNWLQAAGCELRLADMTWQFGRGR